MTCILWSKIEEKFFSEFYINIFIIDYGHGLSFSSKKNLRIYVQNGSLD